MFLRNERSVKEFIQLYPIVSTFIIINIVLWALAYVIRLPIGADMYNWGIGLNLLVLNGDYWRLITPIFLHANLEHVLFNCFSLVLFGPALEQMIGKVKFLVFYLLAGIAGNLGTFIIDMTSVTPHLGASGAIYGLFGIYLYMIVFKKHLIDRQSAQIVVIIFAIGLVMTFIRPNINIAAHIFGAIGGFALGPIILHRVLPYFTSRRPR